MTPPLQLASVNMRTLSKHFLLLALCVPCPLIPSLCSPVSLLHISRDGVQFKELGRGYNRTESSRHWWKDLLGIERSLDMLPTQRRDTSGPWAAVWPQATSIPPALRLMLCPSVRPEAMGSITHPDSSPSPSMAQKWKEGRKAQPKPHHRAQTLLVMQQHVSRSSKEWIQ